MLIIALGFCAWLNGWGRGNINIIPFNADDIEHIELNGIYRGAIRSAYVTETEDFQAIINSINSFQHSGSGLKNVFKYGISAGGTSLYEIDIYPLNGEHFTVCLGLNESGQDPSNTEADYWVYNQNKINWFSKTCKGSMRLIYEFLEDGTIVN